MSNCFTISLLALTLFLPFAASADENGADGGTSSLTPPPMLPASPPADVVYPPKETPESPPAAERRLYKLELQDGQLLRGYLAQQTDEEVTLELVSGGKITIPTSQVASLEPDVRATVSSEGSIWFEDPNRTRYFYGPSAFMLRRGEAHFSQKELLFSTLSYGVLDNLSLQVGTVLPALLIGTPGLNGIFAIKAGGKIFDGLHLGGGVQTLVLPLIGGSGGPVVAGLAFVSATVGRPDAHATLSVGTPLAFSFYNGNTNGMSGGFIGTLSANYRVAQNVAFITENWFLIPNLGAFDPVPVGIHSIGVRFMGERLAADVGGVWLWTGPGGVLSAAPIPWVDLTYNFSL